MRLKCQLLELQVGKCRILDVYLDFVNGHHAFNLPPFIKKEPVFTDSFFSLIVLIRLRRLHDS